MALPADIAARHCLLPASINAGLHRTQCECTCGCYPAFSGEIEYGCVLPAAYTWTGAALDAVPMRLCEPCCAEWRLRSVPRRIATFIPPSRETSDHSRP